MARVHRKPAPRNAEYKDLVLNAPYEICIERARYVTQAYKETEGLHPSIRAARAFEKTARSLSLYILDCENIAGNRTSKLVGTSIPVERGEINMVLELDLEVLENRASKPFKIDPDDKKELFHEILPYWKKRSMRAGKKRLWAANDLKIKVKLSPLNLYRNLRSLGLKSMLRVIRGSDFRPAYIFRGMEELAFNNPAIVMNVFDDQGHLVLGHTNIIHTGFAGVREKAENRLEQCRLEGDVDGRAFCEGVLICCEAIRDFAGRYADLARHKSALEKDESRKAELLAMAERCDYVPYHSPRDFREAMQFLWLTQCGALIAYGMGGIFAIGRADQYLYPYYIRDLNAGRITTDQARELIEELLIKLSYNLLLLPAVGKDTGSEMGADNQAVTVGGVGRDGRDATNDLSFLFMEAVMNLRSLTNSFSIRVSEKSPDSWVRKTAEVFSVTSGPAVFNDEVTIRSLNRSGYDLEDARDYAIIGCVEPTSDGSTFGCTSGNDISLTGALEMTLFRGWLWVVGKRVGPDTGDPRKFDSFDRFMAAYKRQVSFMIDTVARMVDLKDQVYAEGFHNPYVSLTLKGCLESAADMTRGGAKYNFSSISARGLGTAADSLAAVKALVYEQKKYTMDDLLRAVRTNFRGKESVRQFLLRKAPKFGCDDDGADAIAKEVAEFFCREVAKKPGYRGGIFRPGFFSYGMHVMEGGFLGATPNGRLSGEPVSNSLSPSNGSERSGPTAVMRSLAKIDQSLISNGCALNIKMLPAMLSTPGKILKLGQLIRGYFAMGGMEVQFNVVDNATLRDAQARPDRYPDLVVRVSGYSAYFTDLGKSIQDEIIARTAFEEY